MILDVSLYRKRIQGLLAQVLLLAIATALMTIFCGGLRLYDRRGLRSNRARGFTLLLVLMLMSMALCAHSCDGVPCLIICEGAA